MMSPIDQRVQEALDGERDPATLAPEQREAYERLTTAVTMLRRPPALSVADRVMAEIRRDPSTVESSPPVPRRWARWFTRRHDVTLRLRPVWTLALAAALAAVLFLQVLPSNSPPLLPTASEGVAQFVGHFPGARSVEVVGSFNDWSRGTLSLRDDNGDGIWHGAAVLPVGQHEYMFVVDGERWVADPLAGRYVDDGFGIGRQNSVLIVRPASEGAL